MVAPGISSIPLITTRVGIPSVWDSTVVTVRKLLPILTYGFDKKLTLVQYLFGIEPNL
ncbi:unannotated protein [freshwater metagenome]|uniref:Unannotated protein n=1 Tax=freshwater metagenome TaxID=449393 RepID=A0A6J6SHY1_9ZZZZ